MLNPKAYENTRPDGFGVLEVVADEGLPRRFVALKRSCLEGEVFGPLAALRLSQTYGYSREECGQVLEAVYRFPLPGDAAVNGVTVRFGDVEIVARLAEREEAEAAYEAAKREGKQAALLTRESPDVFTLQVAGIRPDQEILVLVSYVQLARAEGAGWTLRVPLTTSPRYARSDEVAARHAQGQPLALMRDPEHRFSLDLRVRGASAVESATHALETTPDDGAARVRLRGGEVLPDRDCVLRWSPPAAEMRPGLRVLLHDDAAAGHRYFAALIAPPAAAEAEKPVPRQVVLLVDHSGSMEGAKWEAADWAVKSFLAGLSPEDEFALGLFHNTTRWLQPVRNPGDPQAVARAVEFLERHHDSGGTELGVALEQALDIPRGHAHRSRHALVITDAEVTDAGRILRLAGEEGEREDRRRISVLCIDAAPNSFLAHEMAERGGGVARFLTSDPAEEDITTALDEVLADWAAPVLSGLRLQVSAPGVVGAGRRAAAGTPEGWSALDVGDLPTGRALWVVGRVPSGAGELEFRLVGEGGDEVAACRSEAAETAALGTALKALFGAGRVLGLEFLIGSGWEGDDLGQQLARLGYDPTEVLAPGGRRRVFAENARTDATKALRSLLVREALEYGLASSETAFVAARTEAGQPVEGTVAVANALPAGWSEGFLSTAGMSGMAALPPGPMLGALVQPAAFPVSPRVARRSVRRAAPAGLAMPDAPMADAVAEAAPAGTPAAAPLFTGAPALVGGEAVLLDTDRPEDAGKLPAGVLLTGLELRILDAIPPGGIDSGLCLLLYVEDPAMPRARVRLVDLVRLGGRRPLNVRRDGEQRVRLVLSDPDGAWASSAPAIEVALTW